MTTVTETPEALPVLLSVDEAAAWYGVHKRTVTRWIEDKTISPRCVLRVGRVVRIRLDEFCARHADGRPPRRRTTERAELLARAQAVAKRLGAQGCGVLVDS